MEKSFLILEDGTVFEGCNFGYRADVIGELVFTTAMVGYLETLTDPSYYGQIVVQTFPLIGNYGVIPEDFESDAPRLTAYIAREFCDGPSNFRSAGGLEDFMKENKIVGLSGIDTRALTRRIRESGVMNAAIVSDLKDKPTALASFKIKDAVRSVTKKQRVVETPSCRLGDKKLTEYRVVLWDFGAKGNIARELLKRGCKVVTVPADSRAEDILAERPDGIMLSNGPGDPSENTEIIAELKKLTGKKIPTFGICLGHQLLALANGAKTAKLKYGHRGGNQPAYCTAKDRVYITSQNHGYAVVPETLPPHAVLSWVNGNDGTCEGISYPSQKAFSVQFHPEAAGGPLDTNFLFDDFIKLMEDGKNA